MTWPKNADRNQHAKLLSLLLLCLVICITSPALAGVSIPLTWDPSPSSDVAGYKIYYGTTSHGYTVSVDVGNVLSATINGVNSNTIYYFAATTYTSSGIESDFSNEAAYQAQSTSPPPPVYLPPTLDALSNIAISENAGSQTVNLTGISPGSGQTLIITATSSNPSLIPNPSVNYTSPNTTGSLTFAPALNANGTATITVTANNGLAQSNTVTRTFTVTVASVNQAPTLNPIADITLNYSSSASTAVSLSGISSGAANENQKLTVTAVSSNPQLVANPTVSYTSPNATGSLNLKTASNTNGTATITITVNDGGTSNNVVIQTFTVTVTPVYLPPTLNALANLAINENTGSQTVNLSGIGLGSSSSVTITATSDNPSLIPNPSVNYTSPNTTGSLNFTATTNATGTATITVTANNGQPQNNLITRTFTVAVVAVIQPPTLDALSNVAISENAGTQTANLTGIGLGSGQTMTITAVSSNPALIPNPSVNYTSPSSTGSLTFAPALNANGSATITVTANNGFAQSNLVTRTFTVSVAAVNQAPTLNPISDVALAYTSSATTTINLSGISSGATNENQKLTVTAVSSNPQLVANPTVAYTSPNATGSLSLKTASNTSGSAIITVTVNDGGTSNNVFAQTFTVTVTPVYLPPTLNALGNLAISQNTGLQTVNLSGIGLGSGSAVTITASSDNPSLIPNPAVTYTSPNTTGSLSFAPIADATGTANITVTVNNGQPQNNLVTRTFSVSVAVGLQPPTLDAISNVKINENAGLQTVNLTGISLGTGPSLTITAISSNPSLIPNPSVNYTSPNATGSLNFTPANDATGTATITVTANNGLAQSNTVTRTFYIGVSAVNQTPTLNPIGNVALTYSSSASTTVSLSGISSGAANENQRLTVTAISSNPQLVANPTVTYTSPNATGTLSLKTVGNFSGTAYVTVSVNDGGASNNLTSQTFAVTVTPVYLPPSLNAVGNLAVNQNASLQTVGLSGISLGSGAAVTITAISSNPSLIPNPTVNYTSPNTTGSLNFTPVTDATGTATITVTANNGQPQSNLVTRTFTINVSPGIQPLVGLSPTLDPVGDLTVAFNSGIKRVSLTGINPGPNGTQKIKITAVSSNPKLVPNPKVSYSSPQTTGYLSLKPASGTNGTVLITVTVNDGGSANNIFTRTFNVTVAPNQAPTLDPIGNITLAYNSAAQAISLTGITPGSSEEIQKLKITAISSNPKLVPNPKAKYKSPQTIGTLSFKPAANANGTALITVFINDGAKANNLTIRTFTITIGAPPSIAQANAVAVNSTTTPAATLTSSMGADGKFSVTVNDASGLEYRLEASTDLVHWTSVNTNTAPFTFVDENAGQFTQRFYRAALLSLP